MKQLPLVLRCVAAAVFLAVSQGCVARRSEAPRVTVVTEQTGGDVSLKVGAVLEVRLKSNVAMGYSWIVAPVVNPVLLKQAEVPYEELTAGDKVGVGGMEVWRFNAVKPGRQTLRFESCGPSEKIAPPAKIIAFTVTVV
jgi:inhibitor of cysteine peptidase